MLSGLPASLRRHVSLDGPRLRGQSAPQRLRASGSTFWRVMGPGTVEGLCEWPVTNYQELAAADECDHLGTLDQLKVRNPATHQFETNTTQRAALHVVIWHHFRDERSGWLCSAVAPCHGRRGGDSESVLGLGFCGGCPELHGEGDEKSNVS